MELRNPLSRTAAHQLNIIAVNDDGIGDAGVWRLAAAVQQFGDVRVYAPDRNYSGAGMSIALRDEFELVPALPPDGLNVGTAAYAIAAPPAQVAAIACAHAFPRGPDLVVSGINGGWNPGQQTYVISGTVGAARVAIDRGTTGIAVSAAVGSAPLYPAIAGGVARLVQALREHEMVGEPVLININVPAKFDQTTPVVLTTPGRFTYFAGLRLADQGDRDGRSRVRLAAGAYFDGQIVPGDEADALRAGSVSISVIRPFESQAVLAEPWPSIAAAFGAGRASGVDGGTT